MASNDWVTKRADLQDQISFSFEFFTSHKLLVSIVFCHRNNFFDQLMRPCVFLSAPPCRFFPEIRLGLNHFLPSKSIVLRMCASCKHQVSTRSKAIAAILGPVFAFLLSHGSQPAVAHTFHAAPLENQPQLHTASSKQYRRLFDEAWAPIYILYYPREGLQFSRDDWLDLRNTILSSDDNWSFSSRARVRDTIREAIATLGDPYTAYLDPAEFAEEIRGSGSGAGIGLRLSGSTAGEIGVHVVAPRPESTAERAGVIPGDVVTAVDGVSVASAHITPREAAEMTQGSEGTSVNVELAPKPHRNAQSPWKFVAIRKSEDMKLQPRILQLTREKLSVDPVKTERLKDVGYIRIHYFSQQAKQAVAKSLNSFTAQGITNVVLDVRNCLGGVFQDALCIAAMLLPDGRNIVTTLDGSGIRADHLVQSNDEGAVPKPNRFKVAILINGGSASASEVLAVGLRGNNYATLVGETTYGKGLVQHYFPLSDGSAIRATIGEYLQPNGKKVQQTGVRPDLLCMDPVASDTNKDVCVHKAVHVLSGKSE